MRSARQIKLFAINAFRFIAAFAVMYFAIVFILCKVQVSGKPLIYRACQGIAWKGGYTYERFREFRGDENYDILIFGSSRANRAINPRVLEQHGYSSYNLATDDQTPFNTDLLIHQYVKEGKCKLALIDVYDKVFSQPDLESTVDLVQNVNENDAAWKMAFASKDIRALNSFCVRMMLHNAKPDYEAETDLYKGYRELRSDSVSYSMNFLPYRNGMRNLKALKRTISYLQSIHIPCVLISQPMIFYKRPANHNLFLNDLIPMLKEMNVPFYDFTNNESIITRYDYADECHLDAKGAEQYSKFIAEKIIPLYLSPANKEAQW